MFIHEMNEAECRSALAGANVGRLGCARDNQPYVVPVYFTYDGDHVYGFTTLGQKIDWMRSNPLVCLEIDERISHDQWMSVVIFGRYEELLDTAEFGAARQQAYEVLQRRVMWWEPAYIATAHRDLPHSLAPIFYRIHIDRMTGHRATPDPVEAAGTATEVATTERKWFDGILRHLRPRN